MAILLLAGCPGPEMGSLDQVSVVKYRYTEADAQDVVRVVGEVRNVGELPTPKGEIVARLRGRTGSRKGTNRTELPGLEAGESRQFALAVTSHGTFNSVELTIVAPGTVSDEEEEQGETAGDEADDQEGDTDGA